MSLAIPHPTPELDRRAVMALLARARPNELTTALQAHWPDLPVRDLKPAQVGLVMLRGRIGGDGAAFNLGEATVTRAVVDVSEGLRGYAMTLGRNRDHARAAAIIDALWQRPDHREMIARDILTPIAERLADTRRRHAAETAATRVDFFTLVRGEPA